MSSKTIAFKLKIDVNGKENIVSAIVPAQELGKAINQAKEAAATAKAKIFDFNQAVMAFKNAGEAVSTLNQALGSFATAYQNVEVANKRLQTVMEERMAATTADIASIKSLISAQNQLGIIGGSVQKAGAQQVATFLTQKESLLTLIPAMNDLIAQQKGLNASEQDAQAIGNLFGKVMQGQTSALKRVGITFTEAQEQVLKMGTEQERAAMLAEVVTANVGHMNAALGTTAAGNMKQFSNRLAGIKVKIGEFANTIQPTLSMITSFTMLLSSAGGAITAVRTAITLLGGTVTMVSTFFKGVWAQSVRLAQATVVALRATVYTANVSFKAWRAGSITLTAALRGVAVGATTAKMAIRGLMASTVIGAALVALGYAIEKLIEYLTGSADAADQETEALNANTEAVDRNAERRKAIQSVQDDAASRYSDERNKVKQLTAVIHDNTASLADRQTAIRNLQAIIPSYHASIAKDGSIFRENISAVNSYIESLEDLAAAEAAFDAIKKSYEQEIGIRQAYNFWNKKYAQTSDQIKALNGDKDYVTTDTPHSNPVGNLQNQLGFHPTTPTTPTPDINKGTDFNANPIVQAAHTRQADRDRNKQEQKILAQRAAAQEKASHYGSQLSDLEDYRRDVLATLRPGARAKYNTMRANGGYIAGAGIGAPTQAAPGKAGGHATTHTATSGANTTPQPQQGSLKDLDQQISKLREEAQATSDVTQAQEKLAQAAALTAQRKDLAIRLGIEAPDKAHKSPTKWKCSSSNSSKPKKTMSKPTP